MSASLLGRVVGERIELDKPVEGLDGKRVRVTLEVVDSDELPQGLHEDPVARAIREAPLDDQPVTAEERACIEESKRDARYVTSSQIRAKLNLAKNRG